MSESFIKKLLKRLNGSQVILKSDNTEHSYSANRNALAVLFSDHPHFVKGVSDFRLKYRLPSEGFLSEADALCWELQNRELYTELVKEIGKFISLFSFNSVYVGDIQAYCYEIVVCPSRSNKWSKNNIPSLIIVDTDEDKNVNAHLITSGRRYIQIFDWTTIKDIEKNWSSIQKTEKQKISEHQGNELRRIIWQLKSKGLGYKEIHKELRERYAYLYADLPNNVFDESYIGIYAKRYEDSLRRLKDF